jgi:hypothetical protein
MPLVLAAGIGGKAGSSAQRSAEPASADERIIEAKTVIAPVIARMAFSLVSAAPSPRKKDSVTPAIYNRLPFARCWP